MTEYWERVQGRWDEAVTAAEAGLADGPPPLRRQWLPFLPLPFSPIAVTGVRGAGKTVLCDALLGRTGQSYQIPDRSPDTEDLRIKTGARRKVRSHLSVVPGQPVATEREDILDELFRERNKPRGVIHVVSWGHDLIWKRGIREGLVRERENTDLSVDTATLRATNLADELTDFEATCDLLTETWSSVSPRSSDIWLVIAVTKCDLYWPERAAARDYYIPGAGQRDSGFAARLAELVVTLTPRRLKRVAVLPVSSLGRPQELMPGATVASDLAAEKQRALLGRLRAVIGEFNAK